MRKAAFLCQASLTFPCVSSHLLQVKTLVAPAFSSTSGRATWSLYGFELLDASPLVPKTQGGATTWPGLRTSYPTQDFTTTDPCLGPDAQKRPTSLLLVLPPRPHVRLCGPSVTIAFDPTHVGVQSHGLFWGAIPPWFVLGVIPVVCSGCDPPWFVLGVIPVVCSGVRSPMVCSGVR